MPTTIIEQTSHWIQQVVIGCNFCPFAARAVQKNSIHYEVLADAGIKNSLEAVAHSFKQLDENPAIETSFIILPSGFGSFAAYLQLVGLAEKRLRKLGYSGVYQIASFHPDYAFGGAPKNDAANYTNRSPYPMLHLLREDSITKALAHFTDPEKIPERNIKFAREKGVAYMRALREACLV